MYSRSSLFVLAIGFGVLIVLIAILTFGAVRRADTIYRDMQTAQDSYSQMETLRRNMISDMYLADILVRDYLLDPSPQNAPRHLHCHPGFSPKTAGSAIREAER
jgi:hypothetical protein